MRVRAFVAAVIALAANAAGGAPPQSPPPPPAADAPNAPYAIRGIVFPAGFNGRIDCALASLEACGDTNALVWDAPFERAVRAFLDGRRRAYLWHEDGSEGPDATAPLVADSMMEVLAGPPDPAMRIGPYLAFSACRQHSCPEKGIAVLTPEGDIVALGILHFWNAPGEVEDRACCGDNPDFDIYHRRVADIARLLPALRGWAIARAGEGYRRPGQPPARLAGLRLFAVAAGEG